MNSIVTYRQQGQKGSIGCMQNMRPKGVAGNNTM